MQILDFSAAVGRPLTEFESHDVWFTAVLRSASAGVVCMRIGPGGKIGAHLAAANQLFLVVEGEGWVRSAPSAAVGIRAGQAAFWTSGENHEVSTEAGLVGIVIEGRGIEPALPAARGPR